ncbi:MAG TPA: OmpA family protein [Rhodanobacteraceae bacterium]
MSSTIYRAACLVVGMTAMVAFAGCSNYVKRSEFNATIAKLQNKDQSLQQQIDSLSQAMKQGFAKYDTEITAMQGRISVNSVAHFAFNKATLRDQDKAKLDEFAKVMKAYHSNAIVTVEGFADPAGSVAYNKKLGLARADAVRNYLVNQDGMSASQVRAVSYGKAKDRLVKPGAKGPGTTGMDNRRATLVVDFAGAAS